MNNNQHALKSRTGLIYWWTLLCLLLVTGAVNLQVPLYHHYAEISHSSHAISALAFAAYVAGLVPVLLGFAGASDRFGRKSILLIALLCSFSATLLMTFYPSMGYLFAARVLQGVGVGLAMGTVTAYLSEQRPNTEKSVSAHVALASSLGFGGGALATTGSMLVSATDVPMSFWGALLALFVAMAGLFYAPPSLRNSGAAMTRLPKFIKGNFAAYAGICAAWSVSGLVIALLPAQLATHGLAAWTGPALFLVNIIGIAFQPMARRFSSRTNMAIGTLLVPLGYLIMMLGAQIGSIEYLLLGSSVAGAACYGFTYLGGLTYIVERAGEDKARAVSGYFLAAYFGFAIPNILVGFLADSVGITDAMQVFGLFIALVHVAIFFMVLSTRPGPLAILILGKQRE